MSIENKCDFFLLILISWYLDSNDNKGQLDFDFKKN